ncbi:MAG: hypothetical protein A2X12_10805 [Bacteroidetes bacterium GWE2_29_8]|nr:MAG: hypothetical protein A2X12_10805 [Bacteroidetes bacterium GWE2_29_8]OFY17414.1 MAG: hypothetical protein A2X02_00770 [Bacteroidetes bacterium GWF2_29_10]
MKILTAFFFILFFITIKIFPQDIFEPLNTLKLSLNTEYTTYLKDFKYYDNVSLRLLTEGKYDSLKIVTKESIKNGHDWFYLRMRRGIAFYNTEKYFTASNNFIKAYKFNKDEALNKSYLHYSMINTSRNTESLKFNNNYNYNEAGLYIGIDNNSPMSKINNYIISSNKAIPYLESEYSTNKTFINPTFSHRIKKMIISHSLSYMQIQNNKYYHLGGFDTIIDNLKTKIIDYQIISSFNLKKIVIEPSFHFFRTNKESSFLDLNTFRTQSSSFNDYLFAFKIYKQINIFKPEINYSFAKSSSFRNNQIGFSLNVYPFNNLNTNIFGTYQVLNNQFETKGLYKIGIVTKLFTKLYCEANISKGNHSFFNLNNGNLYYNINNINEEIKQIINFGLYYYPSRKIELSLTIQQINKDVFMYNNVPENINFTIKNNILFNDYLIFGGIKWKLN